MMNTNSDWAIPESSCIKYIQIFRGNDLGGTGFISGQQARVILLQSGLPQKLLAKIWNLADVDADGQLTVEEFILANHLIDCVRRGEPLPDILPPHLIPPSSRGLPSLSSTSSLSSSMPSLSAGMMPTPMGARIAPANTGVSMLPSSASAISFQQQVMQNSATLPRQSPVIMGDAGKLHRSGSLSTTNFAPSMMLTEWAIPQPSKLKYTQLFNTHDRTRSGFLTGPQARNILLQSGLPQATLAEIWTLSDVDVDGRLTCEEFVLSMHLIDCVKAGDTLPARLPPELVPPSQRRRRSSSGSTPSLMATQTASVDLINTSEDGLMLSDGRKGSAHTFEDKRRENFEKGQAELERRRQMLLEQQRREKEDRDRKEREEFERREKIRLEQERRRQQELERQMQKHRESEAAKEEERKKILEQREAARREMERQRLIEWENQRKQEMMTQKQRAQELYAQLKSKKKNLVIEYEQICNQVEQLVEQVEETRKKVAESKSDIDKMRGDRDVKLKEINFLKTQMKNLQDRQLLVEQDKINLSTQLKDIALTNEQGVSDSAKFALQNKQIRINQLKTQIVEAEGEKENRKQDIENSHSQLKALRDNFETLINKTKKFQEDYNSRIEIARHLVEEHKQVQDKPFEAAWGDDKTNEWPVETNVKQSTESGQYRAVFKFEARDPDELSLEIGDIVTLIPDPNAEPGWLQGSNHGKIGWFPEAYIEPLTSSNQQPLESFDVSNTMHSKAFNENGFSQPKNSDFSQPDIISNFRGTSEAIPFSQNEPEQAFSKTLDSLDNNFESYAAVYPSRTFDDNQISFERGDVIKVKDEEDYWWLGEINGRIGWFPGLYVKPAPGGISSDIDSDFFIAMYQFQSEEVGDLAFQVGELIKVVKKEDEWWTGEIEPNRYGIFPSNHVREATVDELPKPPKPAPPLPMSGDKSGSDKSKLKKPEIVRVIASYKATGPEQLDLDKGQLIQVRKKNSSGWWEGEVQQRGKKRQIGWFPASYVKSLSASGPGSDSSTRSTPDPTRSESDTVVIEKVITLYDFNAERSDELTFRANEIIKVLSKEDNIWWKGQLESDNSIGLFPSNFVSVLEDTENRYCEPYEAAEDSDYHIYAEVDEANNPSDNIEAYEPSNNNDQVEHQRQNPILELIQTEAAYVSDLRNVVEVFEKPLRKANILSERALNAIFLNWTSLLEYNREFLIALQDRQRFYRQQGKDFIEVIGDVLCQYLPGMVDIYIGFCSKQLKAAKILQLKSEKDENFRDFSKRLSASGRTNGLPLGAYLLKPMQRITKYPLLVDKILSKTPIGHIDQASCEKAALFASNLCDQVNEACRNQENEERLEWVQSHVKIIGIDQVITFNSSTKFLGARRLLHSGFLIKVKSGKEILGLLFNDHLLLCVPLQPIGKTNNMWASDRAMASSYRTYKKPLLLNDIDLTDSILPPSSSSSGFDSDSPSCTSHSSIRSHHPSPTPPTAFFTAELNSFSIYIKSMDKNLEFRANSSNDRKNWIRTLTQAKRDYDNGLERRRGSLRPKIETTQGGLGRLLVTLLEASQLSSKNQALNCYCRVSVGDKRFGQESHTQITQTKVARCCFPLTETQKNTNGTQIAVFNVTWNYSMQFILREPIRTSCLHFICYDENPFSSDEILGEVVIALEELAEETRYTATRPLSKTLKLRKPSDSRNGSIIPVINLKIDLLLFPE
ncbi:dynamin associated protein 160 isoform X2 [Brevipalpus obovatus]|uniref:dynamin associated protein 160 isoform X2 n=1 Tax=Brevipalpus obovatus TaxID=246614 RepID=UPI003D9FA1AF